MNQGIHIRKAAGETDGSPFGNGLGNAAATGVPCEYERIKLQKKIIH
jgi:hypothetical protein